MDFDREQKRQPDILFNLEDNAVTDDLNLHDVLVDDEADVETDYVEDESLSDLNEDILYILEDISNDLNLSGAIVKTVYLTYVESQKDKKLNLRNLDFLKRQQIRQIIIELQTRLSEIL